jgi:hypothetical protein
MKPSKSKPKKAAPAKTPLSKALAKAVPVAKAVPMVKAPVLSRTPAAKPKPLVLVKKAPVLVVTAKAKERIHGVPRSASVMPDSIRHPVARKAWIADQVRNDKTGARNDKSSVRNDSKAAQAKATTKSKLVPKPRVAKPAPNKLRIFQIHYQPEQVAQLDPAFEAYDNTDDASPLLEFNVFRKLHQSELVKGAELWGALSWKFTQKTGLSGADLRGIIASKPGHDVYYCNPYPELEAQYHNLWLQGETAHPNFLVLCQEFFEVTGIRLDHLKAFVPSNLFTASNYFIASPRFWAAYMNFVDDAIAKAESRMSKTARAMIYSSAADRIGVHAGASYLPFIVERLFAVFLAEHEKEFSAYKFALPAKEEGLNVHLKLLRQMKDLSVKNKSLWMATCWVNYRNLYMSNSHGSDWCRKYLKNITPTEFKYVNG